MLLSDGYDNKGCDQSNPLKPSALDAAGAMPSGLPIYSCAMGPSSNQALLEQLATDTNGRYYFMPTIDDRFEIYNFIRGQVTGEGVIVNESSMASRPSVRGFVDGCSDRVTFSIAWPDPKMRYVAREAGGFLIRRPRSTGRPATGTSRSWSTTLSPAGGLSRYRPPDLRTPRTRWADSFAAPSGSTSISVRGVKLPQLLGAGGRSGLQPDLWDALRPNRAGQHLREGLTARQNAPGAAAVAATEMSA